MDKAARLNWPLVIGAFALLAAAVAARAVLQSGSEPLFADTDDAMRLVVVRDLLAGQGWYDHVQHRLNTPFGAEIHWSRLIDLPIAGLILIFSPLGRATAELAAAWIWPLLQLFALLVLSARLSLRLAGPKAQFPGLLLPALAVSILPEFAPGRLDHHGIQVLLTLLMAWCTIEALERPRFALWAGAAAATSLAIGTEGLPSVATTILAMGLIWVLVENRGASLRLFGLAFAAAGALHLVIALPPSRWLEIACDAYSVVFAAIAIISGLLLAALATVPGTAGRPMLRLGLSVVAGAVTLAIIVLAFPQCLGGPYAALDPWLARNWIGRISEAKPIWLSVQALPGFTVGILVPVLAALVVAGLVLGRVDGAARERWLIYGLFLLVATAVMVAQVRGARLAGPLAVPAGAWLVVAARERYLRRSNLRGSAGLVLSWLAFAGIAITMATNLALSTLGIASSPATVLASTKAPAAGKSACLRPAAFADLAALPPERIMTPIDLGSHMLMETPHSVVAAPYHRNQQGVLDTFRFLNAPIDEARSILVGRGISLVVVCEALPEMSGFEPAPDSFVRLLAAGALPTWLVEQTLPGAPLRVFAVLPL